MINERKLEEVVAQYPSYDDERVRHLWDNAYENFNHKVIVLDDDPTGVQTVHGVSVYTDWEEETIESGFLEESQLFFILTNSRAFTEEETKKVHEDIANRVERISCKLNVPYLIISRGDSTLRGHYPLETAVMKDRIEAHGTKVDGEIMLPFFKEGGRLTVDNIHFVQFGENLVPAGETEFARDRTFGYKSSHLGEYIEEKTKGAYRKEDTTYISLDELRSLSIKAMTEKLMNVSDFGKVVVNALEEQDVRVFTVALIAALHKGKTFLYRTAATFTKVIGNISSRPLLTKEQCVDSTSKNGGLIVVGSHVQKTTEQLEALRALTDLHFIEFDCHLVLNTEAFKEETNRVRKEAEAMVSEGVTTVVYTKRERLDLGEGKKEEELKLSVQISDAVTSIVRNFAHRPSFIIGKGGITSSDIGTKGLQVKRATVLGQVSPGIPVWKTNRESTFPHIPYVIFPGNVGAISTLKEVVELLK
jgi:uncharacterized protein YgbK (DUF1537 family)